MTLRGPRIRHRKRLPLDVPVLPSWRLQCRALVARDGATAALPQHVARPFWPPVANQRRERYRRVVAAPRLGRAPAGGRLTEVGMGRGGPSHDFRACQQFSAFRESFARSGDQFCIKRNRV
jgi:hypothetical protein